MRILILCREPRLYSCQRLKQACEQQGFSVDILDPNRMLLKLAYRDNQPYFAVYYQTGENYQQQRPIPELLPDYLAVIPRFGTASTEMGCRVLRHYESQGVAVLNQAQSILLARDKWQSLQTLLAHQIPIPETALAGELFSLHSTLVNEQFPLIIKTLSGSQGVGVMLAEQKSNAQSVLETLRQANVSTLIQQFIPEAKGEDIRAFVVGENVIATMQRRSQNSDFRANIHLGGKAESIELNEAEKQLAIKATKAMGLMVAGVDLIRSATGLKVLEVNASPGLEGIESTTNVDVAGAMIQHLIKQLPKQE